MSVEDLPWSGSYLPERRIEIYDEPTRIFVHQGGQWTEGGSPVDPALIPLLDTRQPYNAELEAQRPAPPPPPGMPPPV